MVDVNANKAETDESAGTQFKCRWHLQGQHIHLTIYTRHDSQITWANCGYLCMREHEFKAFQRQFIMYEYEEVK